MTRHETATRPHLLYRCYDADGQLVYIGVTSMSVEQRLSYHRASHPAVFQQTVRWTSERHPDRESALDAEANAIYRETPPLNTQFNPARNRRAGNTRVEFTAEEMREALDCLPSSWFTGGAA